MNDEDREMLEKYRILFLNLPIIDCHKSWKLLLFDVEKKVISLRFGLSGKPAMDIYGVSSKLGISIDSVGIVELYALRSMLGKRSEII